MKNESRFNELTMRYLDRQLSATEVEEFNQQIRDDAEARAWLGEIAGQAVAMGDLGREQATLHPNLVPLPVPFWNNRESLRRIMAVAAMVALLLGGLAFWAQQKHTGTILTVTQADGEVSWTSGRGACSRLSVGDRLKAGTITVEGETGLTELRFADGTLLTLQGNSEAVIYVDSQKRVRLNKGILYANVTPQPKDHPMLLETATAKAQVLGTVFCLTALPDSTTLDVEQGRVKLRRLADGQAVEVSGQQSAAVSLDTSKRLATSVRTVPSTEWQMDFSRPPGTNWKGMRLPADDLNPTRVCAVPCKAGHKKDGTLVLHHGFTARSKDGFNESLVTLTTNSIIKLRCRSALPTSINIFLSTRRSGGAFGGNFEASIPSHVGVKDTNGWRSMDVPFNQFRVVQATQAASLERLQVFLLFVNSHEKDAGLQACELSVTSQTSAPHNNFAGKEK